MATRAHEAAPLDVLLAALPGLSRPILARLVARAIDRIDEMDGDPDLEPNGDEKDTGNAEDEVFAGNSYFLPTGPGCRISDCDDDREGFQ